MEEYPGAYFDAAVMINVLYAVDDRLKCLRQVHRLLKPGGCIVLSTSHSETDLDRLFSKIQDVLKSKGKWEKLKDDFRHARSSHDEMDALIHRDTKEDIRSYVEKAGFSIKKWFDYEYVGAVVIVVAEKIVN